MSVVQFDPIVTYVSEAANYTPAQNPNLIGTLHDIECPPGRGWVVSLMGPSYFGNSNTQASAQLMVDAADVGQGVTLGYQAWHVGGNGNQLSDGMEQAGYASFTTAQWTGNAQPGVATYQTPAGATVTWTQQDNLDMASQLELVARTMARIKAYKGTELKWLTAAEHAQAVDDYNNGRPATISGWVRHKDWTDRGLSNTTHHDTGDNYPQDLVMSKAIAYYNGAAPTPTPTPTPPPPVQTGFLMALTDAEQTEALDNLRWLRAQLQPGTDGFRKRNSATLGDGLVNMNHNVEGLVNQSNAIAGAVNWLVTAITKNFGGKK